MRKFLSHIKPNLLFKIASYTFLSVSFILLVVYTELYIDKLLNSDNASDLVYANLLIKEHSLLSKNWFYSTDLRIISTQFVYGFFFLFIRDWHAVHVLGNVVMFLILLAALYFLCNQLNLRDWFPVIGGIMLLPISADYLNYMLFITAYIAHVSAAFCLIALFLLTLRTENKLRWVWFSLGLILSLLEGLGGLRIILILGIPLFGASFLFFLIKQDKQRAWMLFYSFLFLFATIVGYLINDKILANYFTFKHYTTVLTDFSMDGLQRFIVDVMRLLGFPLNVELMTVTGIVASVSCLGTLVLAVCSAVLIWKDREAYGDFTCFYTLFVGVAFLAELFLYCFTDMWFVPRYNIPQVLCLYPLIFLALDRKIKDKNLLAFYSAVGLTGITFLSSCIVYKYCARDTTQGFRQAADYLVSEGYESGYATFWNANILTEYSDGVLELWILQVSDPVGIFDLDDTENWLQKKSHATTPPEGKIFLLASENEHESGTISQLDETNLIWNKSGVFVYGFDSYEQAKTLLEN